MVDYVEIFYNSQVLVCCVTIVALAITAHHLFVFDFHLPRQCVPEPSECSDGDFRD